MKKKIFCLAVSVSLLITLAFCPAEFASAKERELPIYRVEREDNLVSISFDCAWGDEYTGKILDVMDDYGVKCTFFMVEFWAKKYPEKVKEIVRRGHEIGTHSKTHPHMAKMSDEKIREELESSLKTIEEISGNKVELFRPPFGEYNDRVIEVSKSLSLFAVQWDVDSLDWKDLSAGEIAERVIKRVKSGSIILCHNNGLHTAESLPIIFKTLIEKGFVFEPIGALIYKNDYKILPDGTQKKL